MQTSAKRKKQPLEQAVREKIIDVKTLSELYKVSQNECWKNGALGKAVIGYWSVLKKGLNMVSIENRFVVGEVDDIYIHMAMDRSLILNL